MGGVGPKFGTHLRVRGARGSFILLIFDQLSRKLDASRTTSTSAEAFSDLLKIFSRGRESVYFFRPKKRRGGAALSDAF